MSVLRPLWGMGQNTAANILSIIGVGVSISEGVFVMFKEVDVSRETL